MIEEKEQFLLPRFDEFLLNLKTNNLSAETVYNYERDLKVFQEFLASEKIDFKNVDKMIILKYKAYLSTEGRKTACEHLGMKKLSSFSINRMLSALRSYLKFLIDMDFSVPLPPDAIKLVKTEKKHPRVSEFDEIVKIIEAPMTLEKNKKVALRNRAILEILFSTGMRISEAVNLKKVQIDKTGRIFIRGKGKKERFVYLTPRAREHLKNYIESNIDINSVYLFLPYKGRNIAQKDNHISTNYLQARIKKYRELLGINIPLSAHGLRHAFATYLAEGGANPAAIQILLGHESLDTTTRYVHASDKYAESHHRQFHPLQK